MKTYGLIADIGGTNIRLATVDSESGEMGAIRSYLCRDYLTIVQVLQEFIETEQKTVKHACLDVACPVDQDWIALTNNHWQFSVSDTRKELGLENLFMINDYTAIALAIPSLDETQKEKIGGGESEPDKAIAVCGPGTGLGVAFLKPYRGQWICLDGEGGHVDFAPQNDLEDFLLKRMRSRFDHVSAERFITGPGLVNLYEGIKDFYSETPETLNPSQISQRAADGSDRCCKEALEVFCQVLGAFAGNLALTAWASGGVYVAGGIAPRMIGFIHQSGFRARFEAKGRFHGSIKRIPTYIITEPEPGLLGSKVYLKQALGW